MKLASVQKAGALQIAINLLDTFRPRLCEKSLVIAKCDVF
jgi:hypothetical protein